MILVLVMPLEASGFVSPLQQVKLGTLNQDVKCNTSLVLVLKLRDNSPACVLPTTVQRLQSHGWILGAYNVTSKGLLIGTVTFYPCSPVERIGQPPCTGNGHNYTVTIYESDKKTIMAKTNSNQNGVYSIALDQGNYSIFVPISNISKNIGQYHFIQIQANKIIIYNIVIDSGIR